MEEPLTWPRRRQRAWLLPSPLQLHPSSQAPDPPPCVLFDTHYNAQRLGSLASSPLQGRRKSLSTPASPSGASESPRGASGNGSQSARGPGGDGVSEAMALAVAAAEKLEGEGAAGVVKGPTGPPRQSLARPKVWINFCDSRFSSAGRSFCLSDNGVNIAPVSNQEQRENAARSLR